MIFHEKLLHNHLECHYEEQMGVDSKLADKCRDAALKLIEKDRF